MKKTGKTLATMGLLSLVLLPIIPAASSMDSTSELDKPVPVAIAQPLAARPGSTPWDPVLPESAMLVLVGSALLGLAAVVRRL